MIKVRILKEVYTDKQNRFFCASDDPELKSMCGDPKKEPKNEEQIEEMSAAGGAGASISGGGRHIDDDPIEEMYSTSSGQSRGRWRGPPVDEFAGYKERANYQKLQNVPPPKRRLKIRFKR
tara:strand:+ start:1313 stop:1675 length:363 start_codon:yes stop_codon:yes gene_type:complete